MKAFMMKTVSMLSLAADAVRFTDRAICDR